MMAAIEAGSFGGCMPRLTPWASSLVGLFLVAGCAGGPMKTKVAEGLAYDCGAMGKAYIQFGGGGYLPGQRALAKGNVWNPAQQARPRMRSTARLTFKDREGVYDLIAEWSEEGLRYRSEVPFEGEDYLIWSVGSDHQEILDEWQKKFPGRLTPEDARLGLRASADPVASEMGNIHPEAGRHTPVGVPHATCRRLGRDGAGHGATSGGGEEHGADQHEPEGEHDEPHAP
jgi:hypothetical protein